MTSFHDGTELLIERHALLLPYFILYLFTQVCAIGSGGRTDFLRFAGSASCAGDTGIKRRCVLKNIFKFRIIKALYFTVCRQRKWTV